MWFLYGFWPWKYEKVRTKPLQKYYSQDIVEIWTFMLRFCHNLYEDRQEIKAYSMVLPVDVKASEIRQEILSYRANNGKFLQNTILQK